MRINNNMMAMNTHRQLGTANAGGAKSMEKLSSGMRINRAGDDAAGLAISEKMRGQIRGLNQASANAQDGISLLQTAEGALNETHAILQRMRELAVQSSTDTNTDADRGEIQKEVDQLASEITRISTDTEFNTMKLLDGSYDGKKFHIGANTGQNTTINVNNMSSGSLGVEGNNGLVKEGVSSNAVIVTTNSALASADVADKFNVEKLGKPQTVGTTADARYVLKDSDSNILGVSADGKTWSLVNATETLTSRLEDVTFGAAVTMDIGADANFTSVKSGVIEITANTDGTDMKIKADNTLIDKPGLASGTYEVVTSGIPLPTAGVGATPAAGTQALVDNNGKVVAYGNAAHEWQDVKGELLFDGTALNIGGAGTKVKIGGDGIDVSSQASANSAITTINDALENVSGERSKLGAMQNRLEHTIKNLDTSAENLQASEARIRDVDMAKEMMEQTKQNILAQASTAMLAQANQAPQAVLQLLR